MRVNQESPPEKRLEARKQQTQMKLPSLSQQRFLNLNMAEQRREIRKQKLVFQSVYLEASADEKIDREVKKATKDLTSLLSKIESPLSRIDVVQKKYSELLSDMRRLERDNFKNKKKSEQLQKEKDHGRMELSKTIGVKEKLEKLCRELQRENKKAKVINLVEYIC
jgi:chromosome segregation ATPase